MLWTEMSYNRFDKMAKIEYLADDDITGEDFQDELDETDSPLFARNRRILQSAGEDDT